MVSSAISIRSPVPRDRAAWRTLWQAYNRFYQATVPEEVSEATWQRLLDPASAIGGLVAESEKGEVLGFLNYVTHPRTWSKADTVYMEDLYVAERARGLGVGRALCEALKAVALDRGLSQIYWNTQESNHAARTLYDRLATKDDFIRYVMKLG